MPKISSRERVFKALDFQPVDVLPVGPYVSNYAARHAGITLDQYCTDPRQMAQAHLEAWDEFGYDIVFLQSDNYYIAEGFGCKTRIHRDTTVTLERPPVEHLDEVFKLQVPDPQWDGRMPVYLEAIERVHDAIGGEVVIRCPGTGPFALASYLIGTERFLLETAKVQFKSPDARPDVINHILDLATEALISFGKAEFDAGADLVQCGDSLASLDMISPKMYEEFVFPRHQKVVQAWKAHGGKTMLHICGDNSRVMGLYARVGYDLIELDSKVSLAEARKIVGTRAALIGNLDPVHVILRGSVELVRKKAEEAIQAAGTKGFILGIGCEAPLDTPPENIKALVEVARNTPGH